MSSAGFAAGMGAAEPFPGRESAMSPLGIVQAAACGLALGASVAILEFVYYYPLVSSPHKLGVLALLSAFLTWSGEAALLAIVIALFERWKAPAFLTPRALATAVIAGSAAAVLAWQGFTFYVLRERFGVWLFRDHLGLAQPVNWSGTVLYHVWVIAVFGGMAAVVYYSRQGNARMLAALSAAELRREASQARVAEAELNALRARVDPEILFQSMTKLERLYDTDPFAADRLLEELIVYLRKEGK
jgi:hypothetical protein